MTDRGQQEPDTPPRTSGGAAADEPGEMELISQVDHDLDDAVIRGEIGVLPDGLLPVAQALAALRARAADEPVAPMSDALRAQLTTPNVVALRAARSLRRAVAVVAAAAVAVVVIGVGATQNRLPTPIQDVVSSTAEVLGIDLPHSDERSDHLRDGDLERVRDDSASNKLAEGKAGDDGPSFEPALPAVPAAPGSPEGPATPATPATPAVPPDRQQDARGSQQGSPPETPEPSVPDSRPGGPGAEKEDTPPGELSGGGDTQGDGDEQGDDMQGGVGTQSEGDGESATRTGRTDGSVTKANARQG